MMKCLDTNAETMDYRQIFEKTFHSFDAVIFIDLKENKILELKSSSKFPLLHSSDDAQDTIQKFRATVYPEDLKIFEAFNLFSGQTLFSEIRCKDTNEKFRWCCCQLVPVSEHSYYAMYLDLTDCRNEGIQLKNEYLKKQSAYDLSTQLLVQKYNAVVNHADIVLIEYTPKTRMLSISSNLHDKLMSIPDFNGTYDEFIATDYVYENDKPMINSVIEKLKFVSCTSLGVSIKNIEGEYFRCEADFYGVYGQDGSVVSIVGSLKPVDQPSGYASETKEDKYRDYATGLLSGKAFCDNLKSVIEKNSDKNYAVIMFDIERFKSVNEVYGVQAGDSVIRYVALKMNEVFNYDGCLTARFMSDFFGILMPYENESDIGQAIKLLNSKISLYKHISLKYAYGVYKIADKSIPPRLICDYANMAKNSVKGNHINNIAFYTEGMKDRIIEEIFIENDMEKALE
ncbi:MAG: diguanylate cyclase, partial [Oscillospiraceae bacterium]|nr:diguanylate cyclase [Oscillospiraceae bacterium]